MNPRIESLEGLLSLKSLKQFSFAHTGKFSLSRDAPRILAQLTSLTELRILDHRTPGYDLCYLHRKVPLLFLLKFLHLLRLLLQLDDMHISKTQSIALTKTVVMIISCYVCKDKWA